MMGLPELLSLPVEVQGLILEYVSHKPLTLMSAHLSSSVQYSCVASLI